MIFAGISDYAEIVEDDGDYSTPGQDYQIDREQITLTEILGEGQFGDVHRGIFTDTVSMYTQSIK